MISCAEVVKRLRITSMICNCMGIQKIIFFTPMDQLVPTLSSAYPGYFVWIMLIYVSQKLCQCMQINFQLSFIWCSKIHGLVSCKRMWSLCNFKCRHYRVLRQFWFGQEIALVLCCLYGFRFVFENRSLDWHVGETIILVWEHQSFLPIDYYMHF